MRWVKRLAVAVIVVVLVVPATLLVGGRSWLLSGLPDYGQTLSVSGLAAPVRIVRDIRAVPRIHAATMADAYFALGFVHAGDRLWQMDMMRRLGAGRLAEIMPGGLDDWALRSDRSMRSLGLYRLAESSYAALAPEVRAALEVYAAGVNACLESWHGPLPVEFQVLGYRPEPWRPADTLVWAKLQALQLSGNFREELLRARLSAVLTPPQLSDLFPSDSGPPTLAAELGDAGVRFADLAERVATALPEPFGPDTASNEWVVDGAHSASGKPVLANDPHLGLQAPILWYLARIETPELTLAGATVPGVPFHILGHNGTIAWGATSTGSDTQDMVVKRLAEGDPSRYQTTLGAVPFETRTETIRHRDGSSESFIVRASRHGPVLPEDSPLGNPRAAAGHVLALSFTGLSDRDTSTEAFFRLNRARDWAGFTAALRLYQSPQLNFSYADTGGTIGFISPGLVPVRTRGNGLLPVPGWTGTWEWTGVIPFEELPQAVNPPSGRFVNANNPPAGPGYPRLLAAHWPDPVRARRINTLLDKTGPQSVAASVAMQKDILTLPARRLLPLMLPRPGDDTKALSRTAQKAVALLRAWNFQAGRSQPAPLIFSWWLRELNRLMFAERLGPMFRDYWNLHPRVIEHILTEAPAWCDRPGRTQSRSCSDLLRASLETTVLELTGRHGENPAAWSWGDEHRAALDHPLFARIPGLRQLFAIGTAVDGDSFTLNQDGSRIADDKAPFADVHGPGLRAVYDLADLDQSLFMIATGQSGNPLSPYYRDLVRPWRDGSLIALGPGTGGAPLATMVLRPR
ncbi:MAG: penicillin acylase family protein [Rhodospirillaceae bacterium]